MAPLISVIVPVYNVEKYFERCIRAIIEQKYSNLEIILINDGSTDRSGTICDDWAKRDSRIVVIHQNNFHLTHLLFFNNQKIYFIFHNLITLHTFFHINLVHA